jgi:hypothetical protein
MPSNGEEETKEDDQEEEEEVKIHGAALNICVEGNTS